MSTVEDLAYLSRRAHTEALATGEQTPANMREFGHLPMRVVNGIPELDGTRMRQDQIEDAVEILERQLGVRARLSDAFTDVENFMLSYGKAGVRKQDVVKETQVPEATTRRILNQMVESGFLVVKLERTRGDKGTRRRRYFIADSYDRGDSYAGHIGSERTGTQDLNLRQGMHLGAIEGDTGIRYHGTAVQGVTCMCRRCQDALEDGLIGELRSKARARGDRAAAFDAGLLLRRMRRERQDREFKAAMEAGLAAREAS